MAGKKNEENEKKDKKPEKAKKPGVLTRVKRSFRDLRGEVKKVVWPTKKQVLNNTGIVIVMVVISGAIIGVLDLLLKFGVGQFLRGAL